MSSMTLQYLMRHVVNDVAVPGAPFRRWRYCTWCAMSSMTLLYLMRHLVEDVPGEAVDDEPVVVRLVEHDEVWVAGDARLPVPVGHVDAQVRAAWRINTHSSCKTIHVSAKDTAQMRRVLICSPCKVRLIDSDSSDFTHHNVAQSNINGFLGSPLHRYDR